MALQQLQADSGQTITSSVVTGLTRSLSRNRHQLMRLRDISGWGATYEPTHNLTSGSGAISARRRLMTLSRGSEGNITHSLNTALLGGTSYPILEAALGTAVGVASGGAGLLFTAATLGISLSRRTSRVLAREGDEVWWVEEIGLDGRDTVHVGALIIYDPFRNAGGFTAARGWLIHEERHELTV